MGDGYQAIWDIDRALALDNSLPQGYTGRASAYLRVGEDYLGRRHYGKARESFLKALQDSQEAVRQDPADYYAHRSCGFALWNLEDYAAAAQSFDQAIQRLDGAAADLTPELYTYKGETLGTVGLVKEQREVQEIALEAFDSALAGSADPGEQSWINYSKGNYLLSLKRAKDALPCFIQARKITPAYPWAYYGQGKAHYLLGQLAEAAEALEALLDLPAVLESGLAPYAQIGLGLLAEQAGDKKAAQDVMLQRWLTIRPRQIIWTGPGYLTSLMLRPRRRRIFKRPWRWRRISFREPAKASWRKRNWAASWPRHTMRWPGFMLRREELPPRKITFSVMPANPWSMRWRLSTKGTISIPWGGVTTTGEFEKAYENLQRAVD